MRTYIIKRVLIFIPSIFLVVLLSFILLHYAPGDAVDRLMIQEGFTENEVLPSDNNLILRNELNNLLGLDLPLFYFSVTSYAEHQNKKNSETPSYAKYLPFLEYHMHNQFHQWLFGNGRYTEGLLRGDMGISWVTGQHVFKMISTRMKWSFLFSFIAVFLAFVISVPLGLRAVENPGSRFDRASTTSLIILFSIPVFWLAPLLMMVFCNPDVFNILPTSGIAPPGGFSSEMSGIEIFIHSIPYLILPTICYIYSSLGFISGNVKATVTELMHEDFIRTARAKGLSEKSVIRKHAFRNSLLPLITIFTHVLPMAVSGAVIIETIFTIPGMGLAIFQGMTSLDYPMIIAVFMLTGIFTMLAFLIGDIIYAMADPRISFGRKYAR